MSRIKDLQNYRDRLEFKYKMLIQLYNDYKYVDESKSDVACFKAMKVQEKINRLKYLDNSRI